MKRFAKRLIFLATCGITTWAADTYSMTKSTGEGFGQQRQDARHCQGKQCQGVKTNYEPGPQDVEITPNPGTARVGVPFELKFDATPMCNGQGIVGGKPKGTVKWEAGASQQSVPDALGFVTHTFTSGGKYTVTIDITGTCVDTTGSAPSNPRGSVEVTVLPAATKAAPAKAKK